MIAQKISATQASREHGIKDLMLSRWIQEFIERSPQLFEQAAASNNRDQRIAELERMVGHLAMELEMEKSIQILGLRPERKREMVSMLNEQEDYPISAVCELLERMTPAGLEPAARRLRVMKLHLFWYQ